MDHRLLLGDLSTNIPRGTSVDNSQVDGQALLGRCRRMTDEQLIARPLRPSSLERAKGKTKREPEFMVAALDPRSVEMDTIRRQDKPAPGQSPREFYLNALPPPPVPAPRSTPPARIQPLSPERVRFSFTGSDELLKKLDRAKELLRHKVPYGRLEDVIEEVLDFFLKKKDPDVRLGRRSAIDKA
jgi:hypothetical protein